MSTLQYNLDKNGVHLFEPGKFELYLSKQTITDFFHIYFWDSAPTGEQEMRYRGVPLHKHPGDLFNYQQIISEQKPDFIIECGAFRGGSTLYFADLLNAIGKGKVISIDICERDESWYPEVREHPRTILLEGSSVDPQIIEKVKELTKGSKGNFVILDSLHTRDHVLKELNFYSRFLFPGNYLIVEDSNLNNHPIPPAMHQETSGGGPFEAVEDFLKNENGFAVDAEIEKRFLFSFAPSGYLVKEASKRAC